MRGDQSVRPWWLLGDIAASPNGLPWPRLRGTLGHGKPHVSEALQKPVPKAGMGFFVMGDRSQWFSLGVRKVLVMPLFLSFGKGAGYSSLQGGNQIVKIKDLTPITPPAPRDPFRLRCPR